MTAANHVDSPRRQSGRPDRGSLAPTPVRSSPREHAQRVRVARATTYNANTLSAASVWVKGTAISFALFFVVSLSLTSGFRQVAFVYGGLAVLSGLAFAVAVHIRNKHEWLRDERIRATGLEPMLARQVFAEIEETALIDALVKAADEPRQPATYDQPTFEVAA